ncbi:MAG: DUF554 domain-containing protein [Bacillaceae bacterium]|nr:DUF554 domain-containing protein [Bacillaceae bacterium]
MVLYGTLMNGLGILIGTIFGLFFTKIPERYKDTIMSGIGLIVVIIGVSMGLASDRIVVILLSLLTGAVIGEFYKLEDKLNALGQWIEVKFQKTGSQSMIAQGFVTASLIFVIGAMAVIGALDSGLRGDHEILITKAVIDGFVAMVLTTTLGFGVVFSIIPVLLYQGTIAIFATQIEQLLPDHFLQLFIEDMTSTGGLLILAIGLNLLNITNIRVANLLPSLLTVGFILLAYTWVQSLF